MEDLKNKTPIELQKMFNDIKERHEIVKEEIVNCTVTIDEMTVILNNKLAELTEIEKNYVLIVEEFDNR